LEVSWGNRRFEALDGGRKSSTTAKAAANAEPQTSSIADDGHGSATTEHDYIKMADLLQDMDDGDEGYDDSNEPVRDPETVELFESIVSRLDDDDILFGSPRWLENFREMKQATIDPLYKDCLKHWMTLRFNLQMLMVKARHGWSDTVALTTYYVSLMIHTQRETRCPPTPIGRRSSSGQWQ